MSASSSDFTFGSRASNDAGCSHRSSHVEEAPRNQTVALSASAARQGEPSTESSSMAQSTVRLSARPQFFPSQPGARPNSKAALSTSSPSTQTTPDLLLKSARSFFLWSSSLRSSPDSLSNIFLMFCLCCLHCFPHSRSTSCCICKAAALPASRPNRSFRVAKHSSNRCIARCALAFRYNAFVIRWSGKASRRARAFSTDLSAASKSPFFM
mmetsp:Transcript_100546/g.255863  ORF Transcript_100546/g.255863 Transcript_100546/m.255863 type:complete len:211 (+) Transcript_100546:706-1338(+)